MRKPGRATQCGNLLPILHTCRLPPVTRRTPSPPKRNRHPLTPHPPIQQTSPHNNLKQQDLVSRMSYCLPGKNTPVRRPLMTPQSTRRSPDRRLHGTGRCPAEARGLRHDTHDTLARPPIKRAGLPFYRPSPVRRNYNRLNLPTPDRSKIPNCLLLRQPHGPSCWRHPDPNPLRVYGRTSTNNRPWTCIFSPLLPG